MPETATITQVRDAVADVPEHEAQTAESQGLPGAFDAEPEANTWLAWDGWRMRVPEEWRPLRIRKEDGVGRIMLGDQAQAVMRIRWWSPQERRFSADRWLEKRMLALTGDAHFQEAAPWGGDFDRAVYLPDIESSEGVRSSVWYGYSEQADQALELMINNYAGEEALRRIRDVTLPSLGVTPADAPTLWAVFRTSFIAPAGFELGEHQLNLGHVALAFYRNKERLLLRQMYPARLALRRMGLEDWMVRPPFMERRRVKWGETTPWAADTPEGELAGIQRPAVKRFPLPLRWFASRRSLAVTAHDPERNRLLEAVHDAPRTPDPELVGDAIVTMNRIHD
jgi:hypothetical protein